MTNQERERAGPPTHTHDGDCEKDVVCPSCGQQGFDGRGHHTVAGTRMYVYGCWNCGTEFAVEDDQPLQP